MAGSKEDVETVRAFFQNLRARGLGDPLLVVSDGAPGIIGRSRNASPARRASAVWRIGCATSQRRSRPILGPNSRRGPPPAIRRRRGRSRANWRPASAPITPTSCPVRSPVSRTISRPASRTCACRSRIVVSQGRRPPRTAVRRGTAAAEIIPTASARSRCSSSCSARSSEPPNDGAACASRSSNSDRSPLSEQNSTTNITLQSRRWPGQPSPEFEQIQALTKPLTRNPVRGEELP